MQAGSQLKTAIKPCFSVCGNMLQTRRRPIPSRTQPFIGDDGFVLEGLLPIDVTDDEEIKQLIHRDEEKRYRDHTASFYLAQC